MSQAIDPAIHVVAGALLDGSGQVLIAQRPAGKHMAGGWEFPGGKLALGEAPFAGLVRELSEELSVTVVTAIPVIAYRHDYADRSVLLDLWFVTAYKGKPVSAEGQPIKWVALSELERAGLLAADRPMIVPLIEAISRGV